MPADFISPRVCILICEIILTLPPMSFGRDYVTPDKACISKEGNGDLPDFGPARYFAGDKGKGLDAVLKASCVTKEQDVRRGRQAD